MEKKTAFATRKCFRNIRLDMKAVNRTEEIGYSVMIEGLKYLGKKEIEPMANEAREDLNITTAYDLDENRYTLAREIEKKIAKKFPPEQIPEFRVEIKYILIP